VSTQRLQAFTLFGRKAITGRPATIWELIMSEQTNNEVTKETGVEIEGATFDENGAIVGVDEELLDDVSGGLVSANNTGCGNSANLSC
jgi:hypothetical protein